LLLALAQDSFEELRDQLQTAAGASSHGDPAERLRAVCTAYLDFAATRPQHYRLMFGGLGIAAEAIGTSDASRDEVAALGQDALAVFTTSMQACVAARPFRQHQPARRRHRPLARPARPGPPARSHCRLPLARRHHHPHRDIPGPPNSRRSQPHTDKPMP
jgi:hypothetical protein